MKAVEFRKVSFRYEEGMDDVLKEADFFVNYGEIALLSGCSGEGKSTVLSLICGIIPNITPGILSGAILLEGENILGKKIEKICRSVSVVLQNAEAQIIQQIVEDEIAFGCENFAFSKEKISKCIGESCKVMKLEPQWKTRTLSGGQKQRLMTAAALATGQKILVLDEPLANLDKEGALLLMKALKGLAQAGYAVLIVEHRLDRVLPYADTVWCIRKGKMEQVADRKAYLLSQAGIIGDECQANKIGKEILQAKQVGFCVGGRTILTDLTFTIKKGERLLLLGENGCGKTTLMRMLSRLCKPSRGSITQQLDPTLGQLSKGSQRWFQKVGVVYQNPNYQLFMPSVRQEIEYGASSKEYAEEMMELFELTHLAERHPQALSEGQKRRISIAAVAAGKPKILLLDEPTVGQDYQGLKRLVEVLNTLHEKTGNTMITVTHDMRCAESLCDRALCISQGKIAGEGGKEFVRNYFVQQ